ncbi:MAG TPA: 30S ribosomal protein S2 [candidate division Zixibacteria bacterium]|nr:30S ribosomal protein S2 [candidate division Zixibacteria bacterium]MDD4916900.1 30S ribosomal protein S2 [candidate division Zixibacteria bacterium]MDM7972158.1 30S ribosomal protein S2 [candidate division Zixibacteria bacterium]HOD66736.1 30S ribosomal protein S2 [candidate division Zixibacteria bacterium]HOZ07329.1 30S ribosomal protein S2 [candidate division Zixibacteria bacterium]
MVSPQVKDLLEAGVHFGHQTRRWNPKMKPFIFAARNGIYIIDLQKTVNALEQARRKMAETVGKGKSVLFIGTKKQAQDVIKEESARCGGYYVTERWLGGMLTNFQTIKHSVKKLKDIEKMRVDGTLEKFSKKERSRIEHEAGKLQKYLGGIKEMGHLPGLVVIVDARKERIAVAEAHKLGIPIIGIVDTNADPDLIDFPIAGNDDAIKSIRILMHALVDAAVEAKSTVVTEMLAASEREGAPGNGHSPAAGRHDVANKDQAE